MLKIILTVGIPASGKSTWARSEYDQHLDYVLISRDDIRNMIDNGKWSKEKEQFIIKLRNDILISAIKNNKNVIIHDTNLNKKIFNDICKLVKYLDLNIEVSEKFFTIDLNEAIERDSRRIGNAHVGKIVIERMYKEWLKIKNNQQRKESFYKLPKSEPIIFNEKLQNSIIVDLDGTIALFDHHRGPYETSKCADDKLNLPLAKILLTMRNNDYKLIFMSGRSSEFENQTRIFLDKYIGPDYLLFMRNSGDQRRDSIIKEELFDSNVRNKFNVLCWFDDRDQIIEMVRNRLNLSCFQVNYGNF